MCLVRYRYTPLALATMHGHLDVARLLLESKANGSEAQFNGLTLLHLAIVNEQPLVSMQGILRA